MTTTDKLTDEQWLIQHLEDDAEACSAVNGSKDITTKDARRAEVTVKRLIRERDDARRASQAAPAPSDGLREALQPILALIELTECGEITGLHWADQFGLYLLGDDGEPVYCAAKLTFEQLGKIASIAPRAALTPAPAQDGGGPLTDRQLRDQITGADR